MQLLVIHPCGSKLNVSGVMFILCSAEQNIASVVILMQKAFLVLIDSYILDILDFDILLIGPELASLMSMMYNNVTHDSSNKPSVDISFH